VDIFVVSIISCKTDCFSLPVTFSGHSSCSEGEFWRLVAVVLCGLFEKIVGGASRGHPSCKEKGTMQLKYYCQDFV